MVGKAPEGIAQAAKAAAAEHSPTPWVKHYSRDDSGDIGIAAPGAGNVIAEVFSEINEAGKKEIAIAEANANFLLCAVNCHDDLVKACQYIVDAGENGDEMTAIEMARAALAKAKAGGA